jgi:hypothetical protein
LATELEMGVFFASTTVNTSRRSSRLPTAGKRVPAGADMIFRVF